MSTLKKIRDFLTSEVMLFAFACAYMIIGFGTVNIITCGNNYFNIFCNVVKFWGFIIIFACLFDKRKWKKDLRLLLLCLFIVTYIASCWVSAPFGGIMNNIKGVAWLIIQTILLAGLLNKGAQSKWLHRLFVVYIAISTIFALVSLLILFIGYIYVPSLSEGDTLWMGLCVGRLYGFYKDPNYGAIASCICLFLLAFLLIRKFSVARFFGVVLLALPEICYIAFTGSRTAFVSIMASLFVFAFALVFVRMRDKKRKLWKRILCGAGVAITSCALLFAVFFVLPSAFDKVAPGWLASHGGSVSDTLQIFPRQLGNETNSELGVAQINTEDQQEALKGTNKDASTTARSTSLVEELEVQYAPASNDVNITATNDINSTTINDANSTVDTGHTGLMSRSEEGDVSNNRFELWKTAINIWLTSPFIGVSHYNILEYAKAMFPDSRYATMGQVTSHNAYLDVLAAQGIIGLVIFVALIIITIVGFVKLLAKHKGKHAYMLCAILGVFILLLASACFYPELIYINTVDALFFWLIMSIVRSEEHFLN